MTKQHEYTDSLEFDKAVGVLSEEELVELGWPVDNANRICFTQLQLLGEFVEFLNIINYEGEQYHIATDLDPCGLDDDEGMVGLSSTVNCIAFVNRLDQYLCKGDDDEMIYLAETESEENL